jgi:hypothetical protein
MVIAQHRREHETVKRLNAQRVVSSTPVTVYRLPVFGSYPIRGTTSDLRFNAFAPNGIRWIRIIIVIIQGKRFARKLRAPNAKNRCTGQVYNYEQSF